LVELARLELWWDGPHFLLHDQKSWPKSVIEQNPECVMEEVKRSVLVSKDFRKCDSADCVTLMSSERVEGDNWRLSPKDIQIGTESMPGF